MISSRIVVFTTGMALLFLSSPRIASADYAAVSLKVASRELRSGLGNALAAKRMGGLTRLAGVVYDKSTGDLIVVGQRNEGEASLYAEDFAIALRSLFVERTWPLVSIDKTKESLATGMQTVQFAGGIGNTRFGRDLLDADVVLKKLALGELDASVWGIRSYFELFKDYWQRTGDEDSVQSRFWFTTGEPLCGIRDGVVVVQRLKVLVETRVQSATTGGRPVADVSKRRDGVGDEFASAITAAYDEISQYYPEVRRVNSLFDFVGLAAGIKKLSMNYPTCKPDLEFWLAQFRVPAIQTRTNYPLLSTNAVVRRTGNERRMVIDGGIELKALIRELREGSVEAFRDLVLASRPGKESMVWVVPLQGWQIPGYTESENAVVGATNDSDQSNVGDAKPGCNLTRQILPVDLGSRVNPVQMELGLSPIPKWEPPVGTIGRFPTPQYSPNVGGVLLSGTATVSGKSAGNVDLSRGGFSLVVDGQNAQLDPKTFRKFITALWAVYYSDQDPGISIDPIEWGGKDHVVRYIGRVINTDLGRVMREADYLMKKWAVGTERPNEPGFMNPDDVKGQKGGSYYGASSRFWFVPENMSFKRSGGALVFDQIGRAHV